MNSPSSGTKLVRKWAVSPLGEDATCWGLPVSDKTEEMIMIYELSYDLCKVFHNDFCNVRAEKAAAAKPSDAGNRSPRARG